MVELDKAWSPSPGRRSNAGLVRVEHPGDYATFNSNQLRDGTENGAGKSTLVKIVAGLHNPTEGEVLLDGTPLGPVDVKAMERHGVFLVTQEPAIVNPLSVAENLVLGRWPHRGPWVDVRAMRRLAAEYLQGTGLDPAAPAGRLSAVDRRKLNILRALHSGGRLIILNEPTTALTMADRRVLFDFMRN